MTVTLEFDAERRLGPFTYDAQFSAREEVLVLFGHSGAGKSLTLRLTAGLLRPDRGRITVGGSTVFDSVAGVNLPPQQRRVGYVVQELALFDHMSVGGNIAFGVPRGRDRKRRVAELLELLDLSGFKERSPKTLSGGQRQRVALARAIAREAPILLLDEPFSALDDSLRTAMRKELLRLRTELGLTILFVTHDLREAHFLADRITVFEAGRLLQIGTREEIFRRPSSRRVAELTGVSNIWRGIVAGQGGDSVRVIVAGAELRCAPGGRHTPFAAGSEVEVIVRAERINLRREPVGSAEPNLIAATITEEYAYGTSHILHLAPDGPGPQLQVELPARPYEVLGVAGRKRWTVQIPPEDLHLVRAGPGEAAGGLS